MHVNRVDVTLAGFLPGLSLAFPGDWFEDDVSILLNPPSVFFSIGRSDCKLGDTFTGLSENSSLFLSAEMSMDSDGDGLNVTFPLRISGEDSSDLYRWRWERGRCRRDCNSGRVRWELK